VGDFSVSDEIVPSDSEDPSLTLSRQSTLTNGAISPFLHHSNHEWGGSVADWLACWTQAQKGPGSNQSYSRRGRVTVLGKLLTPIVPLFTKQQNW